MSKKPSFAPKPAREQDPESWVKNREAPPEPKAPKKRLTLDIDAELHHRVRVGCAKKGVVMADEIRKFLEERFPPEAR